ncbi:hypothetical protein [Dactylosporangium sp. NPDC050588]|uniref:hypothetical protein n=1 Tax=Dactylosporangium sp. NPDC050588 TaxID=3157211 RepID=UPI0033F132AA
MWLKAFDLIRVVAGVMSRPATGVFSLNTTVEVGMDAITVEQTAEALATEPADGPGDV